ncbi:type II toxin-antitoxin system Phd/YefM family antitoxin [Kineosporia babensis]|uniref:Antitoxin n=1 Tax=Kineosporia babensis TaxID=499548 RepID=A0A9X1NE45_9ACTN|nr:type II toxin-antitoxin system Phd/YefM family antitoxin [Kineosporia babensis]MCD5312428.1 type II toxin-antitoxin system Phd/YefM family antitoxin [Kineosporia babensis]
MEINASEARANLYKLIEQVDREQEIVTVTTRDGKRVHLVPDDELSAMQETLHLLASRRGARRLLDSLDNLERGESVAMTLEEFNEFADRAVAVAEVRNPKSA